MAYSLLNFDHPHRWLSNLPAKRWDAKNEKYVFPPKHREDIADGYETYLLGKLTSHALVILNGHWEVDDDTEAMLHRDLVAHAMGAAERAGVTFRPGTSSDNQTVAGELSLTWLKRTVRTATTFALDVWDPRPEEITRRHEAAVRGGRNSHRGPTYKVADLPPGSIKAQAEALGCSRSTIRRLRTQQKLAELAA
jgi:hypothetical protein